MLWLLLLLLAAVGASLSYDDDFASDVQLEEVTNLTFKRPKQIAQAAWQRLLSDPQAVEQLQKVPVSKLGPVLSKFLGAEGGHLRLDRLQRLMDSRIKELDDLRSDTISVQLHTVDGTAVGISSKGVFAALPNIRHFGKGLAALAGNDLGITVGQSQTRPVKHKHMLDGDMAALSMELQQSSASVEQTPSQLQHLSTVLETSGEDKQGPSVIERYVNRCPAWYRIGVPCFAHVILFAFLGAILMDVDLPTSALVCWVLAMVMALCALGALVYSGATGRWAWTDDCLFPPFWLWWY